MRRFLHTPRFVLASSVCSRQSYPGSLREFTVIEMPALSPTMNSGTLVTWKMKVGDRVSVGDVYCEVQTDKATLDFENAADEGFLAKQLCVEGTSDIKVGDGIAIIVDTEAEINSPEVQQYQPKSAIIKNATASPTTQSNVAATESTSAETLHAPKGGAAKVSPYARTVAKELNIPSKTLQEIPPTGGTGEVKRVTADDVRRFAAESAPKTVPTSIVKETTVTAPRPKAAVSGSAAAGAYEDIPLTPIRRVIASRLHYSKNLEVPHYYVSIDIAAESALNVIEHLRIKTQQKISINDYIIKAVAKACMVVPEARTHFMTNPISTADAASLTKLEVYTNNSYLRRYQSVDVCVAVATDNGLFTPIIRDADRKGIAEISAEVKELAGKARNGTLRPDEYQGGTISVSNLGPMGVHNFSAIINPPQSVILAIGTTRYRAKIVPAPSSGDGSSSKSSSLVKKHITTGEAEPYLTCTASFDHRVVDGAVGARWLQQVQDYIENPLSLLA